MNNVLDKFIDDLEKNLAANKAAKVDTITIGAGYYEELVAASIKLNILLELYPKVDLVDFDRLAGEVLGVDRP